MWYLTEVKEPAGPGQPAPASPRYWLGGVAVSPKGRTIGRKHVDIRLKASSVSRTHARITVHKAAFYSSTPVAGRRRHHSTSVSVQDSSAYGTFLKYPPGHASIRTEAAIGHHRRLDKDTPTEVTEGALLAFGAPSAWWRLGWEHIVCLPSRITPVEKSRLSTISGLTSLEVVDTWGTDVTHFVTSQCVATSFKFLTALADGKHVVTMGWAEALRHSVSEACRAITDAANDLAAMTACAIPDAKLFTPPFSAADQVSFSSEELANVFDTTVKKRRVSLFDDVVFAFNREERRSRWASIIETLGGKAVLSKGIGESTARGRVVHVQGEQGAVKRQHELLDSASRAYIPESALIASILRAELSPLDDATPSSAAKAAVAEVTDVATPGPLDESDGDSDDSEPGDALNKPAACQVLPGDDAVEGSKPDPPVPAVEQLRGPNQPVGAKKRGRVTSVDAEGAASEKEKSIVAESVAVIVGAEDEVDNEDVNQRSFFAVGDVATAGDASMPSEKKSIRGSAPTKNSGCDVRPFRRRKLPTGSPIPVKRVRYEEMETSSLHAHVPEPRRRGRGNASSSGAHVVDSEEE